MKKLILLIILSITLFSCQKEQIQIQIPEYGKVEVPVVHNTRNLDREMEWLHKKLWDIVLWGIDPGSWSWEISSATGWKKKYYCEGTFRVCHSKMLQPPLNEPDVNHIWESNNYYFVELKSYQLSLSLNNYLTICNDVENSSFPFPKGQYEIFHNDGIYYIAVSK